MISLDFSSWIFTDDSKVEKAPKLSAMTVMTMMALPQNQKGQGEVDFCEKIGATGLLEGGIKYL